MLPRFSVVTPSFGQLEWLKLCAASIADQEGVEVEHIVQDAGTGALLEAWATTQSRVKLFVESDTGMYDAINRGLQHTSSDVLAYLNCDEQYLPGALQQVVSYFEHHPKIDVLFADAILLDEQGSPLSYRRTIAPSLSHLRLADLNTLTCSTFFRRRLIDQGYLFPTHLKVAGDQHWVFQLLKAGIKMEVMHKPLSVFTFTGQNLSNSQWANAEKFGWLPASEKAHRWMTPAIVFWHRMRKLFAGAYRRRNLTIEIYTRDVPRRRSKISASNIGYKWPKLGTN